jgi:hypothetical protein
MLKLKLSDVSEPKVNEMPLIEAIEKVIITGPTSSPSTLAILIYQLLETMPSVTPQAPKTPSIESLIADIDNIIEKIMLMTSHYEHNLITREDYLSDRKAYVTDIIGLIR